MLLGNELCYCQFSYWYPLLQKYTMKSKVINLPVDVNEEFLKYLRSDGIILPKHPGATEEGTSTNVPSFPSLSTSLEEAFNALTDTRYNYVFVKTNWSCPSDAKWILTGQNMKCYSVDDIYMILKASDRVQYDMNCLSRLRSLECGDNVSCESQSTPMTTPSSASADTSTNVSSCGCSDTLSIVLRKWANLNPSMEFRCFVRNRMLIGELTVLYPVSSYVFYCVEYRFSMHVSYI